jgi:TonB family protein
MKRDLLLSFSALLLCVLPMPAQTTANPLKGGGALVAPVAIKTVNPQYPSEGFLQKGQNAIVLVKLIVDSDGMPQNVAIERSAGEKFDKSALDVVRKYRFRPATRDGKPISSKVVIQVAFRSCQGSMSDCEAMAKRQNGASNHASTSGATQDPQTNGPVTGQN